MKCQYCGSNLQIEDAVCPHCGRENPHYIQHRKDMAAYQADYSATKQEVLENASRLNRKTVRITVLAVLVALCAVAAVFCFFADDIRYARQEKEVARNKAYYETVIQDFMKETDATGLYAYTQRNGLAYSDAMREYDRVYYVSSSYSMFYEYAMELVSEGEENKYYTAAERCEDLARYVGNMYEYSEKQSYDKEEYFTPDKTAYMNAVLEKTHVLLKGYFGLTDEEIALILEKTDSWLANLLYERYEDEKK